MKVSEIVNEIINQNKSKLTKAKLLKTKKAVLLDILNNGEVIEQPDKPIQPNQDKLDELQKKIQQHIKEDDIYYQEKKIEEQLNKKNLDEPEPIPEVQEFKPEPKFKPKNRPTPPLPKPAKSAKIAKPAKPAKIPKVKNQYIRNELLDIKLPEKPEPLPEPVRKPRKERLIEFSDDEEIKEPELTFKTETVPEVQKVKPETVEKKQPTITEIRTEIKDMCKQYIDLIKKDINDYKHNMMSYDDLINNYKSLTDEIDEEIHYIIEDDDIPDNLKKFINRTFDLVEDRINQLH